MNLRKLLSLLNLRFKHSSVSNHGSSNGYQQDEQMKTIFEFPKRENSFFVFDEDGRRVNCDILFTFESNEGKQYVVYTERTKDNDGKVQVYANIYDLSGNEMELLPIETEAEWDMLQMILESIQRKIKEGIPLG